MRKVFVHYQDGLYNVIDKATGRSIGKSNDVLLFNATYRRMKAIKGWQGILSEEINPTLVDCLQFPFYKLEYVPKIYYPRIAGDPLTPIKHVQFLRLIDGEERFRGRTMLSPSNLSNYLNPWENEEPEEYMEDYNEEDEEDAWGY